MTVLRCNMPQNIIPNISCTDRACLHHKTNQLDLKKIKTYCLIKNDNIGQNGQITLLEPYCSIAQAVIAYNRMFNAMLLLQSSSSSYIAILLC